MPEMPRNFTLPELGLHALADGGIFMISSRDYDYERLFGVNDAAVGRLRNFAKAHACVTSHADHGIVFRKAFARGEGAPT
jgi:hypothetical protein